MTLPLATNPALCAFLATYLTRPSDLGRWLLARVEELAELFADVHLKEAARRQVLVEDTHSLTLSWYQSFQDESLLGNIRCTIVQSVSFLWSDTPAGANPYVAVTFEREVLDAFNLDGLASFTEALPRFSATDIRQLRPYRFGNESYGSVFTLDVDFTKNLVELLDTSLTYQLKVWDRERSFARLSDIMERQVGLPGQSFISAERVTKFVKALLDVPEHQAPLRQALAQFEQQAAAFGFSLQPDIATLDGSAFVGSNGVGHIKAGVGTDLLDDGVPLRAMRAVWSGCWYPDSQQLELEMRVMVLPPYNHDGLNESVRMPGAPLTLTEASIGNTGRFSLWLQRFDGRALQVPEQLQSLAKKSLMEMAP